MNGYYMNEREYTTRSRNGGLSRMVARADRAADVLVALLASLIGALRNPGVRKVIRYTLVAVCFFCFIGLIGGIEQGTVSIGGGIVLGLLLIFIEIFCLK